VLDDPAERERRGSWLLCAAGCWLGGRASCMAAAMLLRCMAGAGPTAAPLAAWAPAAAVHRLGLPPCWGGRFLERMIAGMAILLLLRSATVAAAALLASSPAPPAPQQWVNLTVFHANQANYSAGDIADMNTADALGDLEFTVRAKLLPIECSDPRMAHRASYDCANPEQDATDIAITKLILSINASFIPNGQSDGYCPCNGESNCLMPQREHPCHYARFCFAT
jgi:hypothetical protein